MVGSAKKSAPGGTVDELVDFAALVTLAVEEGKLLDDSGTIVEREVPFIDCVFTRVFLTAPGSLRGARK